MSKFARATGLAQMAGASRAANNGYARLTAGLLARKGEAAPASPSFMTEPGAFAPFGLDDGGLRNRPDPFAAEEEEARAQDAVQEEAAQEGAAEDTDSSAVGQAVHRILARSRLPRKAPAEEAQIRPSAERIAGVTARAEPHRTGASPEFSVQPADGIDLQAAETAGGAESYPNAFTLDAEPASPRENPNGQAAPDMAETGGVEAGCSADGCANQAAAASRTAEQAQTQVRKASQKAKKTGDAVRVPLTVRLPAERYIRLRLAANHLKVSNQDLIAKAVEAYLEALGPRAPKICPCLEKQLL